MDDMLISFYCICKVGPWVQDLLGYTLARLHVTPLTTSLPKPVHFLSWKVHTQACKPTFFRAKSKPASNTAHFDVKTSTSDEKEATGFQLLHFIPQHVVHIACTAMKGLSVTPEMTRSSDVVVVWPAAVKAYTWLGDSVQQQKTIALKPFLKVKSFFILFYFFNFFSFRFFFYFLWSGPIIWGQWMTGSPQYKTKEEEESISQSVQLRKSCPHHSLHPCLFPDPPPPPSETEWEH